MFSYRHAFHAGNHADVLKHLTLLAVIEHLQLKDGGLCLIDSHAGAGVYRLDQEMARTSGESDAGVLRLMAAAEVAQARGATVPAAVQRYLQAVLLQNGDDLPAGGLRQYPGSPWLARARLRAQDRLKLFEVHPTDARLLERAVREQGWGREVEVLRRNGFEGLKALLPPAGRRALVLIDPSYELKTDYAATEGALADALLRCATGCYLVWYPVIGRPEAHTLARRLKTLAQRQHRAWLRAELSVGHEAESGASARVAQGRSRSALRASAMHVVNPPHTLAAQLREALPWVMAALREGPGAAWTVEESAAGSAP